MNIAEEYRAFLEKAWGRPLAVDTETNGVDIRTEKGHAKGVSVAFRNGEVVWRKFFPFHYSDVSFDPELLHGLKLLIENCPEIYFHNAKFDITALESLGIKTPKNWFCTMVMSSMINENWPYNRSLDSLGKLFIGHEGKAKPPEFTTLIKVMGWDGIPAKYITEYAEVDAEITFLLAEYILPKFFKIMGVTVWDYKRRFIETIRNMEIRGVRIDQDYCMTMEHQGRLAMANMRAKLSDANPASNNDMEELIINTWGLPPVFSTKKIKEKNKTKLEAADERAEKKHRELVARFGLGNVPSRPKHTSVGLSFDYEAMRQYRKLVEQSQYPLSTHPTYDPEFTTYVLIYRGWAKASSSYYGAYLERVNEDGRLRPNYVHHKSEEDGGTVTGRLACNNPNLQQIPREADEPWKKVKKAFLPSEGYSLYEVDYSQLELRILTAYAGEESLKKVFLEGRDLFEEMSGELHFPRQTVKKFVYMTNYGAGTDKIARDIEILASAAMSLRDNYYSTYPGFKNVGDTCSALVKRDKRLKLWSGRYRNFVSAEEHFKSMNSLIQGGAADIVERAMVHIFEEIDQRSNGEVRMLLTVHDSIWVEIKKGTEDKWLPLIVEYMTNVKRFGANFDVKFDAEGKVLAE